MFYFLYFLFLLLQLSVWTQFAWEAEFHIKMDKTLKHKELPVVCIHCVQMGKPH